MKKPTASKVNAENNK